jgi:hypothetical protein
MPTAPQKHEHSLDCVGVLCEDDNPPVTMRASDLSDDCSAVLVGSAPEDSFERSSQCVAMVPDDLKKRSRFMRRLSKQNGERELDGILSGEP